jgi:hypothetical protein
MADNFDLKKFLTENKTFENFNPIISKENLSEGDLRSKIREMILTELNPEDYDLNPDDSDFYTDDETEYLKSQGVYDLEDTELEDPYLDKFDKSSYEDEPVGDYELEEAKKKKEEEVEDVEVTDTETEDIPGDMPEETPTTDGGLEDIAANMGGTESELMQNLMDALKIAKGMNNEKLETQIGNTLKFFVSEYIGGGEQ